MDAYNLDQFDKRLLAIVQKDADLTGEQLAEQIGLSASAVQRRLNRLKVKGIIRGSVAVVDPDKVGSPIFFVVGLEVAREKPDLLSRLRAWLAADDMVQEVFYVTGEWDFILVVTAPTMALYEALMARLLAENPNVLRFTTNVSLGIHKRRLFVPLT